MQTLFWEHTLTFCRVLKNTTVNIIAYSLGNFCFGGNNNPADKDTVIYRQTFTFVDGVMQEDDNMTLIPATISGHDEYNDYQPAIAEGDRKTQIENKLIEYSTPLGLSTLNFR